MFGYVSVAQLAADIRENIHRIPSDIDLVVGVPRSGMIPSYLIGLYLNRHVADVETFLASRVLGHGHTRPVGVALENFSAARHILIVDDSVSSGGSMRRTCERIHASGYVGKITRCAAIVAPGKRADIDLWFRELAHPRAFEWNVFHHPDIYKSCFDLDGVLCVDPTEDVNDDGPKYREFICNAVPLHKPTGKIGHIVSARLEKYRSVTEDWLLRNGISYGTLHLMDLPSKEERVRAGNHSKHKADFYKAVDSFLFFESDQNQAEEIANLSGKPVLCVGTMSLHLPGMTSMAAAVRYTRWLTRAPVLNLRDWLRHAMQRKVR
ncbi:MAG: phosphoribosyltransferase family protein [Steroidobacteraceae bacterium]